MLLAARGDENGGQIEIYRIQNRCQILRHLNDHFLQNRKKKRKKNKQSDGLDTTSKDSRSKEDKIDEAQTSLGKNRNLAKKKKKKRSFFWISRKVISQKHHRNSGATG
jgi:hypothetical protein